MKIFIRADGGKAIGIGHIMRMIVLSKELEKTNDVIFICKKDKYGTFDTGIKILKQNNLRVEYITQENVLKEVIHLQKKYNADCIITDSYEVDEEYFNILKKYFKLSGYVDDVSKCYMNVDFIINQNINALDINYSKTTNKSTSLFLGTEYCMIRDEFINAYKKKIYKKQVEDILLTLGGMDEDKNTLKLLNVIMETNRNIHVVIGKAYPNELVEELEILSKENEKIILYKNANMSELMCKCDVAISGCGATVYELCAMKVPSIGIVIAENQEDVAEKVLENRMIFDVFNIKKFDEEKFISSMNKLITDNRIREAIIKNQENAVNILGKYKLANKINELIKGCSYV